MAISEDQAYSELQPHIRPIWNCITRAYQRYREEYPDTPLHRRTTRANIVNDLILANIVSEFDEVPGTKILNRDAHQLRFLSLSDLVTLWFKKLDENRESSNVSTLQAQDMNRGQLNMFGEGQQLIIAGYQLTKDESAIRCVSFSPPNLVRPRWFIDVEEMPQPIVLNRTEPSQRRPRLKIIRGPEQIIL